MYILKSILITGAFLLAAILFGVIIPFSLDLTYILLIIHGILVVLIITFNFIFNSYLRKKLGPKNFKNLFEEKRELSEKDIINYDNSIKHLNRIFNLAKLYIFFVIYLNTAMIALFFRLMLLEKDGEILPFVLIFSFSLISILYGIFKKKKPIYGYQLTRAQYPILYQMLDNIKVKLNVKSKVQLYATNNNNAIIYYNGGIYHISIGIIPLQMLPYEELLSVLFHEFGHLIHRDTFILSKRVSFIDSLESSGSLDSVFLLGQFFISSLYKYLTFEFNLHDTIISKTQEHRSDELVLENNLNEAYISACIKMFYFEQFMERLDLTSTSYEKENPSETLFEDIFNEFLQDLDINITKYQTYISLEIEPKRASHPILRSRMEKFGINDYKINSFSSYNDQEAKDILVNLQKLTPINIKQYGEERNYYYVLSIKDIDDYENNPKEDEVGLIKYAHALFNVRRVEEAYVIYSKIISLYPNCAPAILQIGLIKLSHYNDASGIEDLYTAINLSKDFIDAIEVIANFSLKRGLQDELDRSRKTYLELTQENLNNGYTNAINITKKTKLYSTTISKKMKDDLIHVFEKHDIICAYAIEVEIDTKERLNVIYIVYHKKIKDLQIAADSIYVVTSSQEKSYFLSFVSLPYQIRRLKKTTEPFYNKSIIAKQ